MKIEEIDKNLAVETAAGLNDVVFLNVKNDPFRVYGLYQYKTEPVFHRLPDAVAQKTNEGVQYLQYDTAGGRVRFSTDSPYIAVRCTYPGICHMAHMTLCGSAGFDLFETIAGFDKFVGTFFPTMDQQGYSSVLHCGTNGKMRCFTIHFPLYNHVSTLELGFQKDASVDVGADYRPELPIVYYGSSITQGGCASRPGNAYQNIISAKRNLDHINLGFSGSALAEPAMAEYLASLPMSVLVLDYDHNAPNPEHLEKTHLPLYRTIRAKQPELPIILVTKPDNDMERYNVDRRDMIYRTYRTALAEGDQNLYYIDGYMLFGSDYRDNCTVDGCHPNDCGFVRMAQVIGNEIDRVFRKKASMGS